MTLPGALTIGVSSWDLPVAALLEFAPHAERLGFAGLWLGEHIVTPAQSDSHHPGSHRAQQHAAILTPQTVLDDPLVTLAAVAARTTTLELGTAICLLTLRHPLLVARSAATLHRISGGRARLGVGAGWLAEEFDALDVPFERRFGRFEEAVEVLRLALRGGVFEYHGRHYDLAPMQIGPEPAEVPILLGGNGAQAMTRAARFGDGWLSSGSVTVADALRVRAEFAELRPDDDFRMIVRFAGLDVESVAEAVSHGFTDLMLWAEELWPLHLPLPERVAHLEDAARRLAQAAGVTTLAAGLDVARQAG